MEYKCETCANMCSFWRTDRHEHTRANIRRNKYLIAPYQSGRGMLRGDGGGE